MEDYRKYLNKNAFKWDKNKLEKAVDRLGIALKNVVNRELKKYGYKNINTISSIPLDELRVSPAIKGVLYTYRNVYDEDLSSNGLNRNQLLSKYTYINQAYQYRTLRYKGYQQWIEEEKRIAKENFGETIDESRLTSYWEIYHSFLDENPNLRLPDRYESIKQSVEKVLKQHPEYDVRKDDEENDFEKSKIMEELKDYYNISQSEIDDDFEDLFF